MTESPDAPLHMVYNGSRVGLSIIELNDGEEVHT